jgi:large subunit ribosomal protein L6
MSRIGRKPIEIPDKVQVTVTDGLVQVKGPKGELKRELLPKIRIEQEGNVLRVIRESEDKRTRAFHGLMRQLIANMVTGVTQGFKKELLIEGLGYRAEMKGKKLVMSLGFSHPVEYEAPEGITLKVEGNNKIIVEGIDKELVGQVAAIIRRFRPPEPYKGKGIRYIDEQVRRKAGKAGGK